MDAVSFLGLTPQQVEASGELTEDTISIDTIDRRTYGEAPLSGISFVLDDAGRVRTIQLHADGHEGYRAYAGSTPSGVRFDMSRSAVRSELGVPLRSAEAQNLPGYGWAEAWDRFDLGDVQMHVQYGPNAQSILLISISRP
jgi:hypothetical protein